MLFNVSQIKLSFSAQPKRLVFSHITFGVILDAPNVQRNYCARYLHSHVCFVKRPMLRVV
uniref:Uncharacterized protein n=1 Tax=Brassica oleracea TaxID=3712 RepID=A0A3P6AC48_BRAOL|nr:unnamed protein product [Brassica oleracea]